MLKINTDLLKQYCESLLANQVTGTEHYQYQQWLRYYLDFCHKYQFIAADPDSLPYFIRKLHERDQAMHQQEQASKAIELYYSMPSIKTQDVSEAIKSPKIPRNTSQGTRNNGVENSPKPLAETTQCNIGDNLLTWDQIYWQLKNTIKVRHYSMKTFKTYSGWIHQFQNFVKNKPPESLSTEDVKQFLTFLAVKRKVAASTQNQAMNSILFMFRHITKKEFGDIRGAVRAKRKPYIPSVISRPEIDTVVKNLSYPYNLVVKILYGCGLRLLELRRASPGNST
jgi:site-specific recombinase XerD